MIDGFLNVTVLDLITPIDASIQYHVAYDACAISRERLVTTDVFRHFGWDVEEARQRVMEGFVMSTFRNLLFQRVIPNLRRIGLMTDAIRPKFESLGILEFENLPDDGDIDWSAMERPLDTSEEHSLEQKELQAQMERVLHEKMEQAAAEQAAAEPAAVEKTEVATSA